MTIRMLSYDYERAGLLRSLVPCVAWTVTKGFLVMKILVTGGAGFIGSAVIRHIIGSTADSVVNLYKLTSSHLKTWMGHLLRCVNTTFNGVMSA